MGHKPRKAGQDSRKAQVETPYVELKLEDEDGEFARRHGKKPSLKGGFDPYDRDPLQKKKAEATHQNTDLRKLSEWIRLKREVEELKQLEDSEPRKK